MPIRLSRYYPWLIGLLAFAVTLATSAMLWRYETEERHARIDRITSVIRGRVDDQLAVLAAVRGLHRASPVPVRRAAYERFLASIRPDVRAPGAQGIGFAMPELPSARAAEQRLLADYALKRARWPATDQPVAFPIVMLAPYSERNSVALGFDMHAEAVRRAAMRRAWLTGQPAATDIVELVQEVEGDKQKGFLIYLPLSGTGTAGVRIGDAPPIQGFVYAAYRVRNLFDAALAGQQQAVAGFAAAIGSGDGAREVYRVGNADGLGAETRTIRIADRIWTMRIVDPESAYTQRLSLQLLLLGTLASLLLGLLVYAQSRKVAALTALADERDERAREKDLLLGEMAHRLKNSFARIAALARITARDSDSIEAFLSGFTARLDILSRSQQLLVTGKSSHADLRNLIDYELANTGQQALVQLDGPAVALNETEAQAVALTMHELATNSVKYGALSGQGEVSIIWAEADGCVSLAWEERAIAHIPDLTREGFGTRFMRTLIERQLRGGLTRDASDGGFAVRLNWPRRARVG